MQLLLSLYINLFIKLMARVEFETVVLV